MSATEREGGGAVLRGRLVSEPRQRGAPARPRAGWAEEREWAGARGRGEERAGRGK